MSETSPPPKPPVKRGKFKPPQLIVLQKKPTQTPRPQPNENDRWTQSGAFVIPKSSDREALRVTPAGVHVNPRQGETTSSVASGTEIKLKNLEFIKVLGRGASGEVKLAQDRETKVNYAVKQIPCAQHTKRILDEEVKRLLVSHPCLVRTIQAFVKQDHSLMLIQEYMDAGNLEEILKSCKTKTIKAPDEVISVIARQVLEGLNQLHVSRKTEGGKSQMHRDLKPANILMNKKGECKVADFGITVEVATMGQSTMVGSPPYMSPERIKGGRYSTPADIWAIGLIVAEMALGKFPFVVPTGHVIMQLLEQITASTTLQLPDCSENLTEFVHSLMKQDPGQRPQANDALKLPFIQEYIASPIDVVSEWLLPVLE
eukprot:TRINITY_DN9052_c0_g1_i1.p1 TRINITY_DN9052_c0_g1~~TRINITY_DN9052_c0_g1_i1.p1  ORF type:complete len:372 (+),score=35.62 TRINITY_DN9052_c0_g1_i1:47-1162(+)